MTVRPPASGVPTPSRESAVRKAIRLQISPSGAVRLRNPGPETTAPGTSRASAPASATGEVPATRATANATVDW